MPSVLDAQFGVAAEATYGTPVAVSRFYEIASGDGFEYRPNRVQGGGLRVGRLGPRRDRRVTPNLDAGGSINLEVLSVGFGLLFNLAMGGTPTNTVVSGATRQVVHTLGGPLKPFTGQLGVPRLQADGSTVVDPLTAPGCVIPSFGLAMDTSDILKLKVDIDAREILTGTALATATYPAGGSLFSFAGAALYSGTYTAPTATALASGSAQLANVASLSVDVARNADVGRFLFGAAGKKSIPVPAQAEVTGSMTVAYDSTAFRDAHLADSDMSLVANFTAGPLSSGLETVQVVVPCIRLEGELPKPSGETPKMTCNFTALEDGTNPLLMIVQRTADTAL